MIKNKPTGWDIVRSSGLPGTGNWKSYDRSLDLIYQAASDWGKKTNGHDKLWLCWNINDDWCKLQQKIVLSLGWTPVIGWDPSCSPASRTILPGSIEIDFNERFGFPAMWPHFPMEFSFLWADRLAFWHADLLVRMDKLSALELMFRNLKDGELAAVKSIGGLRNILNLKTHRYWELIGCTTKQASASQFETGCGWWRNFNLHPNTPSEDKAKRNEYYWDSGVGVMYWKRHCGGKVIDISERYVNEGHCSVIGTKNYKKGDSKANELSTNFVLNDVAKRLGLLDFL